MRHRKLGVKQKQHIWELVKIKSPVFGVIVFSCEKEFPLRVTGPRSCESHLTIISDKERLVIEVQNHTIMMCHGLFLRIIQKGICHEPCNRLATYSI